MLIKRKAKRIAKGQKAEDQAVAVQQKGFGTELPPQRSLVEIYFDQKGLITQAQPFYDFYDQTNWCSPKGTRYRNWKLLASDWIFNYEQEQKLRKRQRENMLAN